MGAFHPPPLEGQGEVFLPFLVSAASRSFSSPSSGGARGGVFGGARGGLIRTKKEALLSLFLCCLTRIRTQTDRTRICSATITQLGNMYSFLSKASAKLRHFFGTCKLFSQKSAIFSIILSNRAILGCFRSRFTRNITPTSISHFPEKRHIAPPQKTLLKDTPCPHPTKKHSAAPKTLPQKTQPLLFYSILIVRGVAAGIRRARIRNRVSRPVSSSTR